jgi:putative salt-induced outer membrane protein YdiY
MCTAAQAESFLRSEAGDRDLRIGPVIDCNTIEREGHSTFSKFWRSLMISQRLPRVAFILTTLVFSACHSTHAKKLRGDVVTMKNGDRLTGEVNGLDNGVLSIETDYSSTNLYVDWNQVVTVRSTATYLITFANGVHVTGRIERSPGSDEHPEDVTIVGDNGELHVPYPSVVEMESKKPSVWRQLKGSVDAGVSFTSGNSQISANTDLNVRYSTPKWSASAALGTSFSDQSGGTKTNRNDLSFGGQRFLSRNAYLGGLLDFLHSSQQDLDLRTTLGGGYGRYWKRTTNTEFRWLGGLVYAQESFATPTKKSDSNAEGLLGVAYDSYRFKVGEIHLQAYVFPGLSDSGRVRTTTDNSLVIKLTNNFHFTLSFWDNYDSRPPTTAKKNELGLSSAIGWAF